MARSVRPGYMGIARIGSHTMRCTSFDVNPNQSSTFYDHTIGINDSDPSTSKTKDEWLHTRQTQQRIWRPSPIEISGGMNFPATVTDDGNSAVTNIFSLAAYADYFNLDFWYYCDMGKKFRNCRINTFGFNIQSGDILNIDTNVFGMDILDETSQEQEHDPFRKVAEKLVTWDTVKITVSNYGPIENVLITGFNFQINNNIMNVYTNGPVSLPPIILPTLKPHDLRAGMQQVNGSISIYLDQGQEFIPISMSNFGYAEIKIESPVLNTTMHVVFQSNKMSGSVGPIITELPFVGVDKYFYGGF